MFEGLRNTEDGAGMQTIIRYFLSASGFKHTRHLGPSSFPHQRSSNTAFQASYGESCQGNEVHERQEGHQSHEGNEGYERFLKMAPAVGGLRST